MKECNKCKVEKPLSEYHKLKRSEDGHQYRCKACVREWGRIYKYDEEGNIKPEVLNYAKQNYIKNSSRYKEYMKQYSKDNKDKILKRGRENYKNNPEVTLKRLLRSRFYDALKHNRKNSSILDHLGCSIKEYKLYLEQMFLEPMNWDNHGDIWEIDHIDPVSKGGSWHYTNTQPLFKTTVIAEQYGYDMIGNKNKGARKVKNKL
jgi:transposase-like protein